MNKFFTVFVALCLIGQSQSANLRTSISGDLSPKHRRLSEEGQLNLAVDGRGYFQYRLRVAETDASGDASQVAASADGQYDEAYRDKVDDAAVVIAVAAVAASTNTFTAKDNGADKFANIEVGESILVAAVDTKVCARAGTYTVKSKTDGASGSAAVLTTNEDQVAQAATDECTVVEVNKPVANAAASAGSADGGSEAAADQDSAYFSQTVYSRDGSLHVNKYGYLVDDNGLLLISEGVGADANSKHHIHVPSRAEGVLVTPSGKILAEELGGSAFSKIGQIKLARFENPQGLNIRLKMKSNCAAANEDGFALGNWCAGTDLDGKDHTYLAETDVSGAGILGNPGDQGFGRIVQ